jgi:DNA mismatch repair protein MutS2
VPGKPGSSYTFSIAERIGLPMHLINRARKLVDENHFSLDKLLNSTEQDQQLIEAKKKDLDQLLKENEKLKKEMQQVIHKEKHQQQIELLKEQNQINETKLTYLKETERKLKSLLIEWRKTDDKNKVIKTMQALLFKQPEKQILKKKQRKIDNKFVETKDVVKKGDKVMMTSNRQIGTVMDIRGKKAIVQVGSIPFTLHISELVVIKEKVKQEDEG